jgi:hypothetical protein
LSLCLTKHHAMKTCWRNGGIAPCILTLCTRWRWVVSFTSLPLYPRDKTPWYPLDRRLGVPQSWFVRGGEEKRFNHCTSTESNSGRPACSLFIELATSPLLVSRRRNYKRSGSELSLKAAINEETNKWCIVNMLSPSQPSLIRGFISTGTSPLKPDSVYVYRHHTYKCWLSKYIWYIILDICIVLNFVFLAPVVH